MLLARFNSTSFEEKKLKFMIWSNERTFSLLMLQRKLEDSKTNKQKFM